MEIEENKQVLSYIVCFHNGLMGKCVHNQIHETGYGKELSQIKMTFRFDVFLLFTELMNVKLRLQSTDCTNLYFTSTMV